jgi:hypothetical protein
MNYICRTGMVALSEIIAGIVQEFRKFVSEMILN